MKLCIETFIDKAHKSLYEELTTGHIVCFYFEFK